MDVKQTAKQIAHIWAIEKFQDQDDEDIKYYSRLPPKTFRTEE